MTTKPIPTSGPVQYEVARDRPSRGHNHTTHRPMEPCGFCGVDGSMECDNFCPRPVSDRRRDRFCPAPGCRWSEPKTAPCLCTAPDCDADHSAMAEETFSVVGGHDPATVEAVAERMREYVRAADPLRAPGRCVVCGVDRTKGCGQHPKRADKCMAHGEIVTWAP